MATKAIFNHTDVPVEQDLLEDLIIESIQIYGLDMYYLPQNTTKLDTLFGEDAGTTMYTQAYPVEMYVKNVEGFEGDGNFLQQFGMEIRDQVTFTVARSRFDDLNTGLEMPNEGDLIWFPVTQSMYRIQFVEHESIFYQLGKLHTYDIQCELFEFADELFMTGVQEIDQYGLDIAQGRTFELITGSGTYLTGEYAYQGSDFDSASMKGVVKNFTTSGAPEIEMINVTETPASGVTLIGVDSAASWTVNMPITNIEENELSAIDDSDSGDNWAIEQEAEGWIDFSEENPFSEETY